MAWTVWASPAVVLLRTGVSPQERRRRRGSGFSIQSTLQKTVLIPVVPTFAAFARQIPRRSPHPLYPLSRVSDLRDKPFLPQNMLLPYLSEPPGRWGLPRFFFSKRKRLAKRKQVMPHAVRLGIEKKPARPARTPLTRAFSEIF